MSPTNIGGQDFEAIAAPTPEIYSVSGTVTGPVVQGVAISLQGAATDDTTTDASGNYTFTDLHAGTYVIVAELAGYTFEPQFRIVNLA